MTPGLLQEGAPSSRRWTNRVQSALVLILVPAFSACSSMTDWSKEPVPVSVSAANYSQLSDAELYSRVMLDPINTRPEALAAPRPAQPLYYLVLPGEVYPSDVPLSALYRELEGALEQKGYFNAVYQKRSANAVPRVDYLLRVHFGERPWLAPIVRADRVTWGDDGLVANKYKMNLISVSGSSYDPRVGLSPEDVLRAQRMFEATTIRNFGIGSGPILGVYSRESLWSSFGSDKRLWRDFGEQDLESQDSYLLVVEAFKLDDVKAKGKRAPCVWATFVAVPADRQLKFSEVLRAMVQTATPYFGQTSHGLQAYEVPHGKVFLGNPVEVPVVPKL